MPTKSRWTPPRRRSNTSETPTLGGSKIPRRSSTEIGLSPPPRAMKWLGVYLDRTLSFKTHILKWSAAAQNVARHLAGLGKVYRGVPPTSVTKAMLRSNQGDTEALRWRRDDLVHVSFPPATALLTLVNPFLGFALLAYSPALDFRVFAVGHDGNSTVVSFRNHTDYHTSVSPSMHSGVCMEAIILN